MKQDQCRHRDPLVIESVRYAWSNRELLQPPVRRVTCPTCAKCWVIDLVRPQFLRIMGLRSPGDKRSPYELGPEVLRDLS